MQDLLEAKALALNQADRLIAQYRSRLGESETDVSPLLSVYMTMTTKVITGI